MTPYDRHHQADENTNVADLLDALPPSATFEEMKDALRSHYGYDSLTDGRATDLVASYLYVSQFANDRPWNKDLS